MNNVSTVPAKNTVLLEIHVPNFQQLKKYYSHFVFQEVWQREPDGFKGYLVLKLEDNILCFWAGNEHVYEQDYFKQWPKETKRGYGIEIVVMVKDIHTLYKKVKDQIKVFEPLKQQPWGLEDFRVEDPFGYYLRFTSLHNILDPKNAVE